MWTARIPEIQGRPWQFEQLYVNGRRAVRARTPNRFYFYMNAPRRRSIDPATGQPHKPDDLSFLANAEDIAPLLALPSERLRDVVVASYHSWISAGWRWGYGEVPSARNSIRFNHIHHLGWDVLAEMGGIYTLGEAPGTVLGNNVIHDIDGDGDSGMHGL